MGGDGAAGGTDGSAEEDQRHLISSSVVAVLGPSQSPSSRTNRHFFMDGALRLHAQKVEQWLKKHTI
jgi:hypothetical protein